jgi:hypothetical protein
MVVERLLLMNGWNAWQTRKITPSCAARAGDGTAAESAVHQAGVVNAATAQFREQAVRSICSAVLALAGPSLLQLKQPEQRKRRILEGEIPELDAQLRAWSGERQTLLAQVQQMEAEVVNLAEGAGAIHEEAARHLDTLLSWKEAEGRALQEEVEGSEAEVGRLCGDMGWWRKALVHTPIVGWVVGEDAGVRDARGALRRSKKRRDEVLVECEELTCLKEAYASLQGDSSTTRAAWREWCWSDRGASYWLTRAGGGSEGCRLAASLQRMDAEAQEVVARGRELQRRLDGVVKKKRDLKVQRLRLEGQVLQIGQGAAEPAGLVASVADSAASALCNLQTAWQDLQQLRGSCSKGGGGDMGLGRRDGEDGRAMRASMSKEEAAAEQLVVEMKGQVAGWLARERRRSQRPLPIYRYREQILRCIRDNPVGSWVVGTGELLGKPPFECGAGLWCGVGTS